MTCLRGHVISMSTTVAPVRGCRRCCALVQTLRDRPQFHAWEQAWQRRPPAPHHDPELLPREWVPTL